MRFLFVVLFLWTLDAAYASPAETYLASRDRYVAELNKDPQAADLDKKEAAARADLEAQLKRVVGPIKLEGFQPDGTSNLDTLIQELGFGKLDGVTFKKTKPDTQVVVTTDALLKNWIAAHQDKASGGVPREVKAALMSEDFYTFSISSDAAVSKFADLPIAVPAGDSFVTAMLAIPRQEATADMPTQIMMSVLRGSRVFLATQQVATPVKPIPACTTIWREAQAKADKTFAAYQASDAKNTVLFDDYTKIQTDGDIAYRKCFEAHFKEQPYYVGVVRQAQALADRLK